MWVLVTLGLFIAALGSIVFAFFRIYSSDLGELLYTERLSQMEDITDQLFKNLENVIERRWREVKVQSNLLALEPPQTPDELYALLERSSAPRLWATVR